MPGLGGATGGNGRLRNARCEGSRHASPAGLVVVAEFGRRWPSAGIMRATSCMPARRLTVATRGAYDMNVASEVEGNYLKPSIARNGSVEVVVIGQWWIDGCIAADGG